MSNKYNCFFVELESSGTYISKWETPENKLPIHKFSNFSLDVMCEAYNFWAQHQPIMQYLGRRR